MKEKDGVAELLKIFHDKTGIKTTSIETLLLQVKNWRISRNDYFKANKKELLKEANLMTKYMEFWEMPPDDLQKKEKS